MSKTASIKAKPKAAVKLSDKRLPFRGSISSSKVGSAIKELKREQTVVKPVPNAKEYKSELREWIEFIIEANEDSMIFTPEEVKARVKQFLENQRAKEVKGK